MSKYKSKFEEVVGKYLEEEKREFLYEPDRFFYQRPAHYVPDWKIGENTFIETKGYFSPSHRRNLLSFRMQHPEIKVYLLFQRSTEKINKKSKQTYADWCDKNGFEWADFRMGIPKQWFLTGEQKQNECDSCIIPE